MLEDWIVPFPGCPNFAQTSIVWRRPSPACVRPSSTGTTTETTFCGAKGTSTQLTGSKQQSVWAKWISPLLRIGGRQTSPSGVNSNTKEIVGRKALQG